METNEKDTNAPNDANIVTKGEYADLKGVSKSRVSQWAKAGRLVLTDDGRVMVAQSDARLALTSSPRGASKARSSTTTRPSSSLLDAAYEARQIDNARRARSEAEIAEMKAARARGELVRTDDVIRAINDCAAIIVRHIDQLPYAIYHRLAAESDAHKCLQILLDAVDETRTQIADGIATAEREVDSMAKAQTDGG
ncbi:MAG: hypothetical protein ACK51V_02910 [bacterium]|jgi:phage terminase Nu1 subunit (DNA packaging protein)|nr:hypothetical protein [Betaproteobacteria bacterium]